MDCNARQDDLAWYALNALEGPEHEAVRAHLEAGCPTCQQRLDEVKRVIHQLPLALTPVPPPTTARERLLRRITVPEVQTPPRLVRPERPGDDGSNPAIARGRRTIPWRAWVGGAGIGAALAAGVGALMFRGAAIDGQRKVDDANRHTAVAMGDSASLRQSLATTENALRVAKAQVSRDAEALSALSVASTAQKEKLDEALSELTRRNADLARLQAAVREAQDAARMVELRASKLVFLRPTDANGKSSAMLVWDPGSKSVHLFTSAMNNLPPGRAYELWLINTQKKAVPAGVFSIDSHGSAVLNQAVKIDPGTVVASAISDEPAAGVEQPTGTIRLSGTVQ